MKKTQRKLLSTAVLLLLASCSAKQLPKADDISFAVIGNTLPSSPYSVPDAKFGELISELNNTDIVFTIHIGNMIYSGPAEKSLNDFDIQKQLSDQKKYISCLYSRFYHVEGEYDIYTKNSELFRNEPGFRYYSFNYGNTHFVVLNSNEGMPNHVSDSQISWLKKDFRNHRKYARRIVFVNHVLCLPLDNRKFRGTAVQRQSDALLEIITANNTDLVVSGQDAPYFCFTEGKTTFINTAVSNLSDYTRKSESDYYMIKISDGVINVDGKRLSK